MNYVGIVPGALVCSGKLIQGKYQLPCVSIIEAPNQYVNARVGWKDEVKMFVPLIYKEASTMEDFPKFRVRVFDEKGWIHTRRVYEKDVKGVFDQSSRHIGIMVPNPPESSWNQMDLFKSKLHCYLKVALKLEKWNKSSLFTISEMSLEKEITVDIIRDKEIDYLSGHEPGTNIMLLGASDQMQEAEAFPEQVMEKEMWEKYLEEKYWEEYWDKFAGFDADDPGAEF
jgi:hypothetical protein